jgi:hypothetical protein
MGRKLLFLWSRAFHFVSVNTSPVMWWRNRTESSRSRCYGYTIISSRPLRQGNQNLIDELRQLSWAVCSRRLTAARKKLSLHQVHNGAGCLSVCLLPFHMSINVFNLSNNLKNSLGFILTVSVGAETSCIEIDVLLSFLFLKLPVKLLDNTFGFPTETFIHFPYAC